MRRTNYAPRPLERALAGIGERCTLPALRAPVAIVLAALAAVATTAGVELQRLAVLDRTVGIMNERAAANATNAAQQAANALELIRLQRIETALATAHRAALVGVNDLALLGNRLPSQTWLTRIHADRDGTWAIEGRAGRIPEVGVTLVGLARIDTTARVRLLSLADPAEHGRAFRFSLAWERTAP